MAKSKRSLTGTEKAQPSIIHATVNGNGKAFEIPATDPAQVVRTTVVFSAETDLNLDLCRLKLGTTRNELIRRAVEKFLMEEGFDPHRIPKNLGVSY